MHADPTPASAATSTLLRGVDGVLIEVRDGLVPLDGGSALVRLLRRSGAPAGSCLVGHALTAGGFAVPRVQLQVHGTLASGTHQAARVRVLADAHRLDSQVLRSTVLLQDEGWSALVVAVGQGDLDRDPHRLLALLERAGRQEHESSGSVRPPRQHPSRALDALAVLRACTYRSTGAVVASPTTSLPEAPGHDRQFDYRYCWLRDASLSTAVAALLGQGDDARRYLNFVHEAWGEAPLLERPVLTVRGGPAPREREVPGVSGWSGSTPVRVGNDAAGQRQYDSLSEDGHLPQRYDERERRPDASALMAVAFGLFRRDDPRARRLVDAVLRDLGQGPWVHRYPPDARDGFSGREGAFLPVSFLAVTVLATVGRVGQARARLDAMYAELPRLLSEEVDPDTGRLLGNVPLVWSHAELARALYVTDAAGLRQRWSVAGLWAWRLQPYVALRRTARHPTREPA